MARTKTEAALDAALDEHADDPERAELIRRARRFKSSWIELAESLTQLRKNGRFKEWGYESVEAYAQAELHLRQETVQKLTGSYTFLKSKAPEVLRRDGVGAPIPSYQAIDFLRRAEESEDAPRDVVDEIRKRVMEDGATPSRVANEFRDKVFPIDEATKKDRDSAAMRNVARRLRDLVGETRVIPKRLGGELSEVLDRVLEALEKSDERAA